MPSYARAYESEEGGPYIRTAEVAKILRVSPKTVSRWAKEGRLPHVKTLGGHRRFPEPAIRQLLLDLSERVEPRADFS